MATRSVSVSTYARPMPANARAILIEALRDAHRWLDELLSNPRLVVPRWFAQGAQRLNFRGTASIQPDGVAYVG
jgi:hypothetical protein